ncbi:cytidylyltransferase family-domain-containing protein [Kalaharituber pfeilii]|nr:cytidylyltransferase family-domain-containing protein [Kalaharituber pfeilii]
MSTYSSSTAYDDDLKLQSDCASELDYSSSSSTSTNASIGGSNGSSGVSTPTGGTPPPPLLLSSALSSSAGLLKRRPERSPERGNHLSVPGYENGKRPAVSRSPSPLGLIPIHRSFSKLIHKHEVPRKLLHVSIGGFVVYLYMHGYQPAKLIPPLTAAFIPITTADILRLNWPAFNRFYIRALGALMRESEVRGMNGVVWYLVGSLTVLGVFPKDVATLSILLLSWCDTAASTFGRAFGKYTPRIRKGKSLAGSLASFVVGALTAAVFWGYIVPRTPKFKDDPVNALMWGGKLGFLMGGEASKAVVSGGWALGLMSLWTGLVASVSEAMNVWGLDDNVVIPVVSAVGVWGFLKIFG